VCAAQCMGTRPPSVDSRRPSHVGTLLDLHGCIYCRYNALYILGIILKCPLDGGHEKEFHIHSLKFNYV
jgi:hypothetical protein